MATYIKFNNSDVLYPASITGRLSDSDWDNRASKAIHVEMKYDEAVSMFVDEVEWSIVQDVERVIEVFNERTNEINTEINTETGIEQEGYDDEKHSIDNTIKEIITKTFIEQEVYDNSEYSILGDIVVHKDGTVTVKMGKPTAEEILAILLGEA